MTDQPGGGNEMPHSSARDQEIEELERRLHDLEEAQARDDTRAAAEDEAAAAAASASASSTSATSGRTEAASPPTVVTDPRLDETTTDPVAPSSSKPSWLSTTNHRMAAGLAGLVIVAAALVLRLGPDGGGVGPSSSASGHASASVTAPPTARGLSLDDLKRATVLISADPKDPHLAGWGSGSIVGADGLILTNAHVAANRTPGLGVQFGVSVEALGPETPETMYIYTVDGDAPAVPTYKADLVLADGYLDLAVLRISGMVDGTPVDPATLGLKPVPLGTMSALRAGDQLTILGFPGVAESLRVHVTRGSFENLKDDSRAGPGTWVNTEARIAHGNSGGLAASDAGFLVGIPDQFKQEQDGPGIEYVLRTVDVAAPLIDEARQGKTHDLYKYVPKSSGAETASLIGWAAPGEKGCTDAGPPPHGSTLLRPEINYTGMAKGMSVILYLLAGGGTDAKVIGKIPYSWTDTNSENCITYTFRSGTAPYPDGTYTLRAVTGPNYEQEMAVAGGQIALGGGDEVPSAPPVAEDDIPTVAGAAADEWLLGTGMAQRADVSNCTAGDLSDAQLAAHMIAYVGCDVEGLGDGTGYYLFDSSEALKAYLDDRRAAGRGNRTDVCGGGWHWKSTPDHTEGTLLCSDATIDGSPYGFVQWTEDGWRIFGNVSAVGADPKDLYKAWIDKDIAATP
jgi:S1-C subfamily serine protease